MKRFAVYEKKDGRRWRLTLTIGIKHQAEKSGEKCIENEIYNLKKLSQRKNAVTELFQRVIDFSSILFVDDTIHCHATSFVH